MYLSILKTMSIVLAGQEEQDPREKLLPCANLRNYQWLTQLKNYWVTHSPENLSMNSTTEMNPQAWHQQALRFPKKETEGLVSKFLLVAEEEGNP